MQAQVDVASSAIFGVMTSVIAYTFGINEPTFFAGMWGSIIAVAYFQEGLTRGQALMLVIAGTVTSGYCFVYVSHFVPSIPAPAAAFMTSLLIIPNRKLIMEGLTDLIKAAFKGAKLKISRVFSGKETSK